MIIPYGHKGFGIATYFLQWFRNRIIASFQGRTFWSYYQSIGLEFRYALRKVLSTQDHLTLMLTSHHYVLCLNPSKNYLNTCILNSHTHTNMHLTNNMTSLPLNKHTYLSIKQKRAKHTKETLACIYHGISSQTLARIYHGIKAYSRQQHKQSNQGRNISIRKDPNIRIHP